MIDEPENTDDGKGKGKTDSDGSFGDGKAGAASGVGFRLTVAKSKEVYAEHRSLNAAEATAALVEFCGNVLVASATVVVTFIEKAKMTVANSNSFALLHWIVDFQKNEVSLDANRERGRGRGADSQGLKQKKPPNRKLGPPAGSTGPTGAQ